MSGFASRLSLLGLVENGSVCLFCTFSWWIFSIIMSQCLWGVDGLFAHCRLLIYGNGILWFTMYKLRRHKFSYRYTFIKSMTLVLHIHSTHGQKQLIIIILLFRSLQHPSNNKQKLSPRHALGISEIQIGNRKK